MSGEIYVQGCMSRDAETPVYWGVRSSSEVSADINLMDRALEFKYAARRQHKVLIVWFVPRWQAWVCKHIFRMWVGER